jgi:hypothetical protein
MFNLPGSKENCPHCKSSKMEYYGGTPGGFHFYYRCTNCRKYTEYRVSSKKFLIACSILFLMMVFSIALTLFIFSISPILATLFFLGSVVLFWIVDFKYERNFYESIALEDLQTDLWIIHAASKKSRLVIAATFFVLFVAFLAYIGILFLTLYGNNETWKSGT